MKDTLYMARKELRLALLRASRNKRLMWLLFIWWIGMVLISMYFDIKEYGHLTFFESNRHITK